MGHVLSRRSGFFGICLASMLVGAYVTGCGPLTDARKSMESGNSLAAVAAYQQALSERPGDPGIRQELQLAQAQAASELATQAREELRTENYEAAIQFADQATRLDPQYRTLAGDARRALARTHLARAESHLQLNQYPEARQSARAAQNIAADLTEPAALLAMIDALKHPSWAIRSMRFLMLASLIRQLSLQPAWLSFNPGKQRWLRSKSEWMSADARPPLMPCTHKRGPC